MGHAYDVTNLMFVRICRLDRIRKEQVDALPNLTVIRYYITGVSRLVNGSRKAFKAHL